MNKKDKLKETMKQLCNSMIESANNEAKESPIFEFLMQNDCYLSDPDNLNVMVKHQFDNVLKVIAQSISGSDDMEYLDVYVHWGFYEGHVERLVEKHESSGCCADKTRFILHQFMTKKKDRRKIFGWDRSQYYIPNNGSEDVWMNFIVSLIFLRHGNPDKYLPALMKLEEELMKGGE